MRLKMFFKRAAVLGVCLLLALSAFLFRQVNAEEHGGDTSLSRFEHARIGVQTGTSFDKMVKGKMPDAKVAYFNNKADLVAALTGHKIDAFAIDEPAAQILTQEYSEVTWLPDYLDTYSFALAFPKTKKGEALRNQCNDFLHQLPDGTLDMLASKWFGEDEAAKTMPDSKHLSAENGTLRVATEAGYAPFEYVRDGEIVGYDMEICVMFCEACGYGMDIVDMNFDGILPSVQSGKCDFSAAGINITPEQNALAGDSGNNSLWGGIVSSFNKTFIRENRWKLFVHGVETTLLITVLSILFGTALGFGAFLLCRNGNPAANTIARFCVWLVQGMPMVVLLMVLFYIVFGKVSISGIVVAVIGFTLTFGSSVFSLMKMGVGTVDRGQYEAAYALGHSNSRTFFRIILPQVIPHILPAYQGEIVGLIKATAVVGYIAVQDLTKIGDIVRSRTYEAFFPLIAVTVIYFVLEGLLNMLVGWLRVRSDPKKRSKARILKGVKTDD